MEKQEQLSHQQDILRDLQSKLSQASTEDEKRSIQLRMNVVNAKIEQLRNENSSENVSEDTMIAKDCTEEAPYQKTHFLDEGCMTKKFENMTNREIANYIFGHPHTKFASKMKECDDKEIMKAIRDIKRTNEEAPVTNTSAVATTDLPSMKIDKKKNDELRDSIFMKRDA